MQDRQAIVFAQSRAELDVVRGTTPRTLKEAADAFFVLHVDRLSPSYREWLETRLADFVSFLGPKCQLEKVTIWQLDLWYAELASRETLYADHPYREQVNRSLSPATLYGYVKAVKTFFNWLGKRRLITANPASLMEFPPLPEQPPRHATRREVLTLFDYFQEMGAERNYVAVKLLAATGMRAGGLVGLRKTDVDIKSRLITVREKGRGGGNKGRTVPVDAETIRLLAQYMQSHSCQFAFRARYGCRWSVQGLYQVLRRASERVLHRVVGPHMLRHYFGFESIRRGMPLRVVQLIMGHSSSTTTEIYTRFSPLELREAYDAVYGQ